MVVALERLVVDLERLVVDLERLVVIEIVVAADRGVRPPRSA